MNSLCCVCREPLPAATVTVRCCEASRRWILDQLATVESLWLELPDHLERACGDAGPRVSGNTRTGSAMPPAEHVLDLIGPGGVHDRLGRHLADLLTARGIRALPATGSADRRLTVALTGLRTNLSWAVQAYDLEPLALELQQLVGEMRHATGDVPEKDATTKELGTPCPDCGGQLRYYRTTGAVRCDHCQTDVDAARWTLLAPVT